jgi:hypothetical protein
VNKTYPTGECAKFGAYICPSDASIELRQQQAQFRVDAKAANRENDKQLVIGAVAIVAIGITAGLTLRALPVAAEVKAVVPGSPNAPASSSVQANALGKSLASRQQMGQINSGNGTTIAGGNSTPTLRDSPRLEAQYGGRAGNWEKVKSDTYTARDGSRIETHAYRDPSTGRIVEPKTKILE